MTKKNKIVNKEEKKDSKPIILYLIFNLVLPFVLTIALLIMNPKTSQDESVYASLVLGIILALVFLIMYFKKIIDNIKKINLKMFIFIIVSAIILIVGNDLLSRLLMSLNVEFNNENNLNDMALLYPMTMGIYTVLAAPIMEEFVFRYSLGSLIKNKIAFIIVSGILFGLLHSTSTDIILYVLV